MLLYIVRTFIKPFYDGLYGRDSKNLTQETQTPAVSTSPKSVATTATANTKEIAEQKGEQFEKYIVNKFDKTFFKVIEWRGDKYSNGHFPESNKYPDLEMMLNANGQKHFFAVECKYRSSLNSIPPIDHVQLRNYEQFQEMKGIPVFIAIGIGGTPSAPSSLYIIPLHYYLANKWNPHKLDAFLKKGEHFFYDHNAKRLK